MGELTGQGIMKYLNGSVYEGMWNRNKRSGKSQALYKQRTRLALEYEYL